MAADIGSVQRPFTADSPMVLARELMLQRWKTEGGKPGLWERKGEFWEWYGGKWQKRDEIQMQDAVYLALEEAWTVDGDGMKKIEPTRNLVAEVVRALQAVCRMNKQSVPCWLNGEGRGVNAGGLITFDDVVVDVDQSVATGEVVTYPRTEDWFDPVTIPFKWDPNAKCPEYDAAMKRWSDGDPAWEDLSDRVFGSMLTAKPKHAKVPLLCGKSRAGKGLKMGLLRRVLGAGFFGTDMKAMISEYGLDGVQTCRVISVSELMDLDDGKGEDFVSQVKKIVGRDPTPVNGKWKHMVREPIEATVVWVSNQIPRLPNHSRGISSKLVILPFTVSFEGREDPGLETRLAAELPGIVARWVKGAMRVEAADAGSRFPMTEAGEEMLRQYHLQNNPMDWFLDWAFVPNPEGFVSNEMLHIMREKFEREYKTWFKSPKNHFPAKIERDSSWHVRRGRPHGKERGLIGLSLKLDLGEEENTRMVAEEGYDDE